MDRETPPELSPAERELIAAIPWDRVLLDSWGDGWPWPVGPILDWLEVAVITLEEWTRDNVLNGITGFLGTLWGWLSGRFDSIWNWITDRAGFVLSQIRPIFDWTVTQLWNAARWVAATVAGGWNWLGAHITASAGWLWDNFTAGISVVSSWVWDAAGWLWGNFTAGIAIVSNWVWDAAGWLADLLRAGWDWLWDVTAAGFTAVNAKIDETLQWIQDHVIDPITDHLWAWWDVVKVWTQAMVGAGWQTILRFFAEPFHASFSFVDVLKGIWGGFVAVINAITGGIGVFLGKLWQVWILPLTTELQFVFGALPTIMPTLSRGAQPDLAWTAYQAMGLGMLDRHLRAIFSLWLMKLQPGAWFVDTSFIEKMAYQSIGFDQLLQAAYIPAFDIAIGRNIRYRMNRDMRNELPSRGELEEMFAKHEISPELFAETMALHGFDQEWISIFKSALFRDPRMHEVMRLSEIFAPPTTPDSRALEYAARGGAQGISGADWWLHYKMAKAGYDDVDVPILVDAIKAMNRRREQTLYIMQLRRLHRAGYMTEDEVMASLTGDANPVPMRPDVAAARLSGMRLERLYEETKIREDVVRDMYRKDEIDADELDLALSAVLVDDSQRSLVLSEERIRKLPSVRVAKPPDPLKALLALQREQQRLAIAQFRAYLLDADELQAHLQVIGLTNAFAQVITSLEVVRRDARPRPVKLVYQTDTGRAQLQEGKLQFRAGQISDGDLYALLLRLEVPETMARALVGQELSRIAGRPVKPPPEDPPYYRTEAGRTRIRALQLSFRAGDIDDARLFSGLSGLEIDPDYAQALVDVELARRAGLVQPEPTPELPAYLTEEGRIRVLNLKLAIRKGIIDEFELLDLLLDLEVPRPTAEAIVEQELIRQFTPEEV